MSRSGARPTIGDVARHASVLLALAAIATPARAQNPPAVTGVVFDSLNGRALGGAIVQLIKGTAADSSYATIAGARGEFSFGAVRPGRYILGFMHPLLDSLGLEPPVRSIEIRPATPAREVIAVPSSRRIIGAVCGDAQGGADSSGLLVGHVRDAGSGRQVAGATVVVSRGDLVVDAQGLRRVQREWSSTTDSLGWYAFCALPANAMHAVRARLGAQQSGSLDAQVVAGGITITDLALGASAPSSARLRGRVRDVGGRAIAGAVVVVPGDSAAATTTAGEGGVFSLGGVATGSRTVEVRAIGYAPARVAVMVTPAAVTEVEVVMLERRAALEQVTVFGKRGARSIGMTDFQRRKAQGVGTFLTRDDIHRSPGIDMCSILRRVNGVVVESHSGFSCTVKMRGDNSFLVPCSPGLFVDGARIFGSTEDIDTIVQPTDVAGIEVYRGAATVPVEYLVGQCGSILIWTGH